MSNSCSMFLVDTHNNKPPQTYPISPKTCVEKDGPEKTNVPREASKFEFSEEFSLFDVPLIDAEKNGGPWLFHTKKWEKNTICLKKQNFIHAICFHDSIFSSRVRLRICSCGILQKKQFYNALTCWLVKVGCVGHSKPARKKSYESELGHAAVVFFGNLQKPGKKLPKTKVSYFSAHHRAPTPNKELP